MAAQLAIAGIHLSDVPTLSYDRELFEERTLTRVTANTRRDGKELLELAATAGLHVETTSYPFDRAERRARRPCR